MGTMRRLKRQLAGRNMERLGFAQINKKGKTGESKFSRLWRTYSRGYIAGKQGK